MYLNKSRDFFTNIDTSLCETRLNSTVASSKYLSGAGRIEMLDFYHKFHFGGIVYRQAGEDFDFQDFKDYSSMPLIFKRIS